MALTQTQVSQLYVAIFGRASEGEGNAFWQTQGLSFADTAIAMLETQDSLDYFGGELTDQEFIEFIYNNTLSKTIAEDPEGIQFWVDALNDGYSRGFVVSELVTAATAPENAGAAQDQFLNRVALSNYTADTIYDVPADYATVLGFSPNGDLVVSDDPASLVSAKQAVYAEALASGETFTLTSDQDVLDLSDSTAVDTVKGLILDDGTTDNDTFSAGDSILGNGLTKVSVTVVDSDGVDYVEMEGVDTLEIKAAGETGTVTFDASTYGSDISTISLIGADDLNVNVNDATLEGDITLSLAEGTSGTLDINTATYGDYELEADLSAASDAGGANISLTDEAFTVIAGDDADAYITLDISETATSSDAVIGDIAFGAITLSATGDAYVSIDVDLSADADTSGDATIGSVTIDSIDMSAESGYASFDLWVDANADKGNATIGDITVGDVNALNTGSITLSQEATVATSGNATVGNITVGDVAITLSEDNWFGLYVYDKAFVTGTGDATVGTITMGDVSLDLADDASLTVYLSNTATVSTGVATAGDITVGNITAVLGASSADVWFELENEVYGDEGNVTAGNLTVGNVDVTIGDTSEFTLSASNYVTLSNAASTGTATATAGNVMVGDVVFDIANSATGSIDLGNYVYADKGDVTVGNTTIGNVDAIVGESSDFTVSVSASASAATSGDVTIGDVTIGNVNLALDSAAEAYIYNYAFADAASGNATIGNLTIGDVTASMGIDSYLKVSISADATGSTTGTAIGDVSVGNVTLDGSLAISASAELYVSLSSDGSVGTVTVGDVDVALLGGSSVTYDLGGWAGTSHGDVTLGTVDIVADAINYEAEFSAADGDLGSVTIGDIYLEADDIDWSSMYLHAAGGNIGDVTVGNITLNAATSISIDSGVYVEATSGSIGTVSVGNISIADVASTDTFDVTVTAGDSVGDVTIGDIAYNVEDVDFYAGVYVDAGTDAGNVVVGNITVDAVAAAGAASATVDVTADATDTIGTVTVGNITLSASAQADFSAYASASVQAGLGATTAGALTVGDIMLDATAVNATATLDASNDYAGLEVYLYSAAAMTVGNIDITLTNSVDSSTAWTAAQAYDSAYATVALNADDADITVGDITLSTVYSGESVIEDITDELYSAVVDIDAGTGDITIGDITVSGGLLDSGSNALDNLGNLTGWLTTTTTGDVTVGDIDYSGYDEAATIDVSGFIGAANITAAAGDTTITVNDTQNAITLGAGDDTVVYLADELAGTTAGEIDTISGFTSGSDVIDLSAFIADTSVAVGGTTATYETFLTAAQSAMTFNEYNVFTMTDGTNTYVAVDSDDDVDNTIDFVIELTGVTSVVTADFVVV